MAAPATPCLARIRRLTGAVIALVAMAGMTVAQPAPGPGVAAKTGPAAAPTPAPGKPKPPAAKDTLVVERPVVGVIDLRADGDSQQLAGAIAAAIAGRPELAAVSDAALAAALVGPLADEDTRAVIEATQKYQDALDQLGKFGFSLAIDRAEAGRDLLLKTMPTPTTTALLADLVFAEGLAHFASQHASQARAAFALVHRLTPERKLTPGSYVQDLIDAFDAAATPPAGSATLEVDATGTIWLDGVAQGDGPTTLTVPPGVHIVLASGPEQLPTGVRREVVAGQVTKIGLPRALAPPDRLASRARKALIAAPDPTARAAGLDQIQKLTGMTDAVIVTADPTGRPAVQLWRHGQAGLGKITAIPRPLRVEDADRLIEPLVPRRKIIEPPFGGGIGKGPIVIPKPKVWWKRRWVQIAIIGGVVGLIGGGIAISNASGADSRLGDFGGFGGEPPLGRR